MIRSPEPHRNGPGRAFWRAALPLIVVSIVIVTGACFLRYQAHSELARAQAEATALPLTDRLAPDPLQLTGAVNDAEAMLQQAIAARNLAVGSVLRLDKLAAAMPSGARLTEYHTAGLVSAEGTGQSVLGATAQSWAKLGYHLTVSTTALGSPAGRGAPEIEPNMQIMVTDESPSPPPTLSPMATPNAKAVQ